MLPDGGKICETETPPWRQVKGKHHILCHIPIADLATIDSVIVKTG